MPIHKPPRPPPIHYRPFLDASHLLNYKHYFSRRPAVVERSVHEKTLFDKLIRYEIGPGGWESLMSIKGEVKEETVWVFW